jgi:predicted sugar kinase
MYRMILTLVAVTLSASAFAQKPMPIKPSNPLRKVLLDALRPVIEKDLGQKVKFAVKILNVQGDWAFYGGTALQPSGKMVDLKTTHYRKDEFSDGPSVYALLHKKMGRWKVTKFVVGPTDVAWDSWDDEFGAPRSVMGLPKK